MNNKKNLMNQTKVTNAVEQDVDINALAKRCKDLEVKQHSKTGAERLCIKDKPFSENRSLLAVLYLTGKVSKVEMDKWDDDNIYIPNC